MKIEGFKITTDEKGTLVTLECRLKRALSPDDFRDIVLSLSDEFKLYPAESRDTTDEKSTELSAEDRREAAIEANGVEPPPETSRRRRRSSEGKSADPSPAAAPSAEAVTANGASGQAPVAEGSRRRRRSSDAETAEPESAPASASPASNETSPAPESGNASRRRRTAAADATSAAPSSPTANAKSPSEIADADLSKAASEAARKIGPKGVVAVLNTFSAKTTGELKGDDRRAFIEALKAETSK